MIKTIALILVWTICMVNALFFGDIIVNFLFGNEVSKYTGASTGPMQTMFSIVMLAIIALVLYLYTNLLSKNIKW